MKLRDWSMIIGGASIGLGIASFPDTPTKGAIQLGVGLVNIRIGARLPK